MSSLHVRNITGVWTDNQWSVTFTWMGTLSPQTSPSCYSWVTVPKWKSIGSSLAGWTLLSHPTLLLKWTLTPSWRPLWLYSSQNPKSILTLPEAGPEKGDSASQSKASDQWAIGLEAPKHGVESFLAGHDFLSVICCPLCSLYINISYNMFLLPPLFHQSRFVLFTVSLPLSSIPNWFLI